MYDSRQIANEFIRMGVERKQPFTHLQIQKLVYFAHAWMLGVYGKPLIKNVFKAWTWGPVERVLYDTLVERPRSAPVRTLIQVDETVSLGKEEREVVEEVCALYGSYDGRTLSKLSHEPGTPWHKTEHNAVITDESLRDYYSALDQDDIQEALMDGAPPIWSQSAQVGSAVAMGLRELEAGQSHRMTLAQLQDGASA